MNRRSLFGFVLLNVVVTFVTVFGVFSVLQRIAPQATERPAPAPLMLVVTATKNPLETPAVVIITATPGEAATIAPQPPAQSGTESAVVPTIPPIVNTADQTNGSVSLAGTASAAQTTVANAPTPVLGTIPTLDPSLLPPSLAIDSNPVGTASASGAAGAGGCQNYTLKQGDTAGSIAQTFGVSLANLMSANKLQDKDLVRLQIGQVLIIPINGCGLTTDTPTPSLTPTKLVLPTVPPTSTLAPTADKAQIEVVQIISAGDLASEGVELRNVSGGVIRMQGWTLADSKGTKFTFPDYQMFPRGRVTVYSKAGQNTPVVLYWGQTKALWGDPTQTITISDPTGVVQATFNLSGQATQSASGAG